MKTYREVETKLHAFLIWAQDIGEWWNGRMAVKHELGRKWA
jgi:hypothetical protein